jgi:hypothetical protein
MRLWLSLLLLLLPAGVSAQDWQKIVSRDLRFQLEMPQPVEQTAVGEKEANTGSTRTAWFSKRDDEVFDFDYVDYPTGLISGRDSKTMARDMVRGEADRVFPKPRFKHVRDEPMVLQGWDGYAFDVEDDKGHTVMTRSFIVRDRLYRMVTTHKGSDPSKAASVRFLDSLKLAETRAP